MATNAKSRRKQIVLDLLSSTRVESQEELLGLLRKRGVDATQATVSRDLRELGVYKGPAGYSTTPPPESQQAAAGLAAGHLGDALKLFMLSANEAGNIVVMRTRPGHASPLASEIDRSNLAGVVGTIAGDDTVFLAAATPSRARALCRAARAMVARASGPRP